MKDDLVHKWRNLSKMAISLAVFDAGKESGSGKASVSWKRIEWRTNGTNQFAAIAGNQLGTIGTSKATELKLPSDKLAFVTSHSSFLTRQGLASADFETVFNQLLDEFHLLNLEAPEDDAFFQLIDLSARLAEIVNSLDRGWDNPDVVRFLQAVQGEQLDLNLESLTDELRRVHRRFYGVGRDAPNTVSVSVQAVSIPGGAVNASGDSNLEKGKAPVTFVFSE